MYFLVKVLGSYEALIDENAKQKLLQILGRMERSNLIIRNAAFGISFGELQEFLQAWQLNDFITKLLIIKQWIVYYIFLIGLFKHCCSI